MFLSEFQLSHFSRGGKRHTAYLTSPSDHAQRSTSTFLAENRSSCLCFSFWRVQYGSSAPMQYSDDHGYGSKRNAPNGPDARFNDLGPSKMKLCKWSTVRPAFWTVQTHSGPSELLVRVHIEGIQSPFLYSAHN